MTFHPEPFDHLPLIFLLQNRGIDFASSLYVSKLKVNAGVDKFDNYYFNEVYDRGTGFQINVNDRGAFHSSNSFDDLGEELFVLSNQLAKLHSRKKEDKTSTSTKTDLDDIEKVDKVKIDISKGGLWGEDYKNEISEFVNDVNGLISEYKPHMRYFIDIEVNFIQKRFQSTESVDIQQEYASSLLSIMSESRYGVNPLIRTEILGGIQKSDLEWGKIEGKIAALATDLENLKTASKPKFGHYKVLLSQDAVYSLIHETIGHGCEADQIVNQNSFLTDKMGHKVASSDLTIVDDPHIRSVGWGEYDDEGIKTQGTLLVDEGILSGYLHNKSTAKKLHQISTGKARATSYFSPPEPRQSNIYIEPGDGTENELLEDVKDGLLIGPTLAASTSIYTGEFSIESQISYKIKNGEISEVLGPVTLTGNALNVLNQVSMIGNNPEMIPTVCLKSDNLVYVGSLMPQMTLEKVTIY